MDLFKIRCDNLIKIFSPQERRYNYRKQTYQYKVINLNVSECHTKCKSQ